MGIYVISFLMLPIYSRIFNRRSFCILASAHLFLILALRADRLGVDLASYSVAFNYISSLPLVDVLSRVRLFRVAALPYPFALESGWMLLNWLISHIGLKFHSLLVVCAAINMFACGRLFYKYSEIPWMSFCVVMSVGIYSYMFGILRQSLALSFAILAVAAFCEKKHKMAYTFAFMAFFVHRTSILVIVLFFIIRWNCKSRVAYRTFLLLWCPFALLTPFLYNAVAYPFMKLLGKGYAGHALQWNNLMILLLVIGVAVLFFYNFRNIEHPMEVLSVWSVIAAIYLETIGMMNDNLARSVQFYVFFLSLTIPQVLVKQKNRKVIQLGELLIMALLLGFMIYTLKDSSIVPYALCFGETA